MTIRKKSTLLGSKVIVRLKMSGLPEGLQLVISMNQSTFAYILMEHIHCIDKMFLIADTMNVYLSVQ
jgi:hypothetical protein